MKKYKLTYSAMPQGTAPNLFFKLQTALKCMTRKPEEC